MATIYDKIHETLKEIRRIRELIEQGLAKPEEKQKAFRIAKEAATLFTADIFLRKAEKLSKISHWSKKRLDGFVDPKEADQLDGWIALFEDFQEARKIKSELSNEKIHIQSVVDGEDQHIFITEKGSKEHAHLIFDGGTGEIRIDPKDKLPHDLIKSVQAVLELKTGETVQVTKSAISFVKPESVLPFSKQPIIDFFGGGFSHQSGGGRRKIFSRLDNLGDAAAFNIKLRVEADEVCEDIASEGRIPTIQANSQTSQSIFFEYSHLNIAEKKLTSPRFIFQFQDAGGNKFESSRILLQESRASGGFDIKAGEFIGTKYIN